MDAKSLVAYNLKQIRLERKLTKIKIASLSGLSAREISKIENEEVAITLDTLQKLATGLNLTVAELVKE